MVFLFVSVVVNIKLACLLGFKEMVTTIKKAADSVMTMGYWISMVLAAVLTLLICLDVIFRYFLNRPILWATEVAGYTVLFISFLSMGWILKNEKHVKTDFLLIRLRVETQALVNAVMSCLASIGAAFFMIIASLATIDSIQYGLIAEGPLEMPVSFGFIIVVIGGALLFIQLMIRTRAYWRMFRSGRV